MSFTFQLDIGSFYTPVIGGGYIVIDPFYNEAGITKKKEDDQIFSRSKINGKIKLRQFQYDAIKELATSNTKIPMKVFWNGGEVLQTNFNIRDLFKVDNAISENSAVTVDEYQIILSNLDNEYNILTPGPIVKCNIQDNIILEDLNVKQEVIADSNTSCAQAGTMANTISNYAGDVEDYPSGINEGNYNPLADYKPLRGTNVDTGLPIVVNFSEQWQSLTTLWERSSCNLGHHRCFITTKYQRRVLYTLDTGGQKTLPEDTGWTDLFEPVIIGGFNYHKFAKHPYDLFPSQIITSINYDDCTANRDLTGYTDTYSVNRFRRLDDTIEYLVNEMDSSILFDSDSFSYFDTFIKSGEYPLANLLIARIADVRIDPNTGEPKENPSTIGMMSFDYLFEMLRELMHVYWILEKIGNDYYFRIKHISEINKLLPSFVTYPAHDQTDYKGEDWTKEQSFEYDDSNKFNRITRDVTANSPDFAGVDILIPILDGIKDNTKTIGVSRLFFDIWNIFADSEKYSGTADNQFYLASCDRLDETELLTTFSDQTPPYDFVSFSGGTLLCTSSSGGGKVKSNDLTGYEIYDSFELVFDLDLISGQMPTIGIVEVLPGSVVITQGYFPISQGQNSIIFNLNNTVDYFYLQVSNTADTHFKLNNLSLRLYSFINRKSVGELSGLEVMNNDLSIANIDEDHGKWELPESEAIINNSELPVQVEKKPDRNVNFVTPVWNKDLIIFQSLVKTKITETEQSGDPADERGIDMNSMIISFNEGLTKIEGVF